MSSSELEEKDYMLWSSYTEKEIIMTNETSTRNWSNLIMRCVMMILGACNIYDRVRFILVTNSIIDGGIVGISLMAAELSGISFSIL